MDYFAGLLIEKATDIRIKKRYLIGSILSTLSVLFIFKYYNFFVGNFDFIAQLLHIDYSINSLKILLPIGLSFHTFQSMSYVIEVYWGRQKAEKNFLIYSLYVMFFPQLVAGPIERPQNLLPQFYEEHYFDYERVVGGLRRMLWGFLKKIVVADRLAIFVNVVYNNPTDFTGLPLILATLAFAFQIYYDFSGYSDIAIGAAQVMGFRLMENFKMPYGSKSINEFWKRWHISLSSWFRDYLYIPLGGNRVTVPMWYLNLIIVFLASGLWHGASWTYIIWGLLHGFYLVFSLATREFKDKLFNFLGVFNYPKILIFLKVFFTFFLVNLGWVFFRANSLNDAFYIFRHLFNSLGEQIVNVLSLDFGKILPFSFSNYIATFLVVFIVEYGQFFILKYGWSEISFGIPKFYRYIIYYTVFLLIIFLGQFGKNQFIYFQF